MRAKLAEKEKDYEKAIEDYGKVLQLDPSFFNAAYSKASCENIVGRYDDAIATYNLAFTKDENMPMQTFGSRLTSANNSPVRPYRGGSIRVKSYTAESGIGQNGYSPFRMKSFDLSNAPEQLVEMANNHNQRLFNRNLQQTHKNSNIMKVNSDDDREGNTSVLSNIEEEQQLFNTLTTA